jgi:hypothetical protein
MIVMHIYFHKKKIKTEKIITCIGITQIFLVKEKGESDIARGQKDVQFRKTKQAFPKYTT